MRVANRTKTILAMVLTLGLILPASTWAAGAEPPGPPRPVPRPSGPASGPRGKTKAPSTHLRKPGPKLPPKLKRVQPPAVRPRLLRHPVVRVVLPPYVPRVIVRRGGNLVIREGTTVVREIVPSDEAVAAGDLAVVPTDHVATETTWEVTDLSDDYLVTLRAGEEQITVRMIGVDTPLVGGPDNTPALPEQAKRFAQNLLLHEFVYLESDPNLADQDADGHRVAYLYRVPDKLPLNLELIRQGYALCGASEESVWEEA